MQGREAAQRGEAEGFVGIGGDHERPEAVKLRDDEQNWDEHRQSVAEAAGAPCQGGGQDKGEEPGIASSAYHGPVLVAP